jgi:hypothetical protein
VQNSLVRRRPHPVINTSCTRTTRQQTCDETGVHDLISAIYDAALEPERWQDVLVRLRATGPRRANACAGRKNAAAIRKNAAETKI